MSKLPKFQPEQFPNAPSFYVRWVVYGMLVIVLAPTALIAKLLTGGHFWPGFLGMIIWAPVLWKILLYIHKQGVIRIHVAGPIMLISAVVFGLSFANL